MKSKKKIITLLALVLFFLFSNILKIFIINEQSLEFNEKNQIQIKPSGFWNLTGSPIFIDDNDPNKNWSYTASHYAWCSGSGSWADPYVIENVTIDGQGSGNCIEIKNSDVYFIIQNCSLYNSGSSIYNGGIFLYNVNNCKIINNNCSDNIINGICLVISNNSTLSGNTANNDYCGIFLDFSNNNTFSGNTANNDDCGILLFRSYDNTLSGNTASNNNLYGIYLTLSDNNTLSGNIASNNDEYGIYLRDSDNNTLSGIIASNNDEYGIYLRYSEDNTLSGNLMTFCGISLSGSLAEMASHIIDDTNLVNNKPFYYYVNELGLGSSNFTNAGQIILINCNNSIISGLDISDSSGIYLYYCVNNTLSGNNASNNKDHGIYLRYSNNNTLLGNTANNNSCGIDLYYSDYNTLSVNNASNNDEYGIYLQYSHQNDIFSNNFTNNEEGIKLRYSNDNFFIGNNVTKNSNGIYLKNSDSNKIISNIVNNNTGYTISGSDPLGNGIMLEQSEYNNLTQNIICFNDFAGIYLNDVKNVFLTKNNMNHSGLHILNSMGNFESYHIDKSNTVNNKPIYYYINKSNLKKNNFSNAGQVILVNCNNSVISDQNFAYSTNGIYFSACNNYSIFNNTFDFIKYAGISLNSYGYNNTIIKNNFTYGGLYGISIRNCNYNNITNNKIESTFQGIDLYNCNDTIISYNNISNSQMAGIHCRPGFDDYMMVEIPLKNVFITGNKMKNCGLVLYHSEDYKTNYVIDNTNLVNEKPIYYYIDRNYLSQADFANAGQIYLINCNHTSFSNLDCSFSSAGVLLMKCNNNSISNINCSGNTYNGFGLGQCNNNNLTRIVVNGGLYMGMQLSKCYNNLISDCNVSNSYYGMYLLLCYNNIVVGNSFNNNSHSILISSCTNSSIKNNNISNNKKGTLPSSSEPSGGNGIMFTECSFNNFTNNYIINNEGSGIILSSSNNNNTFSQNIIKNNTEFGVIIESEYSVNHNNSYFLNDFINNGVNAVDLGIENRWDDGFTGNYWDDYVGVDISPTDGIGDIPYLILGTAGVFDTNPLIYPISEDTDGDGLINYEEYVLGDDNYLTNVTNPDTDYDGLSDYWEWLNSTDPWNHDSDFDNMPDGWEVFNSLDPLYDLDNLTDADDDFLLNLYEYRNGTDPQNPDSDFDNMPDGWEVFNSLNPLYNDAFNDTDNDLLKNIYEYSNGTNPQNNDTDSDGMPDGWEVINGLLPLANDSTGDPDGDNLFNVDEFLSGTNPHNDDTDGDSYLDGSEVSRSTDPLNKWWYPMPNLAVIDFRAEDVTEGLPFVLNFTIVNNGIWRAEGIILIIRIEALDLTLYENLANPFSLDEDESITILSEISSLSSAGQFILNISIDPGNLINETYSLKDGNLRESWKTDNSKLHIFKINPGGGDGLDELLTWIVIGIILAVAFAALISFYLVVARPKLREKFASKRLIKSAKDDVRNFEIKVRGFIKSRLKDNYKSIWWEEGIPEYIKQVVDNKINAIKPKKIDATLDKIDFLDFSHYNPIITDKKNWEPIFSDIFSDKTTVESNFESLRVFKSNLYAGNVTTEEMSHYTLFIYTISSYFARGFNIFVSYSTLDTDYFRIKEVAKRLESYPRINKVLFWEEDSQENIVVYMEKTLSMSKVFVFFCSENAVKSKAVADEWQAAFQMRKKGMMKIVPVYEKEELIPNLLMPLLNVKYTKDDFDGFIQKLYDEILR